MGEKKGVILIVAAVCFVMIVAGVAGFLFVFSGSASTKREVKKQLKAAEEYLIAEDYNNAILCYKTVLGKDSENEIAGEGIINAYLKWADSFVAGGNTPMAIRTLETAMLDKEYTKGDQRIADKLKELKDSMAVEEPEEEVVEEVDEGPAFLKTSINESDFDMEVLGKDIREWDLDSICEFVENDTSMHFYKDKGKEKIYRDEDNQLEVYINDEEEFVVVQDRDYYVKILKSSLENCSDSCLVFYEENAQPGLGQVLSGPKFMEGNVYEYLSGYSEELTLYVLDRAINLDEDEDAVIANASLKVSEWTRDNVSSELKGLTINFGTWNVDIHNYSSEKINYIKYNF